MKRIVALLVAAALVPSIASAEGRYGGSMASALSTLVVVASPVIVLTSPIIIVNHIVQDSTKRDRVQVQVTTDKGKAETIELPKKVVADAKLTAGDKLTVEQAKSGAVLSKNDQAIAFLVTPENAKLSRSHELAR